MNFYGNLLLSNTNEVTLHLSGDASAYEVIRLIFGLPTTNSQHESSFGGDTVESIAITHPVSGEVAARKDETYLYPSKHFVMPEDRIKAAVGEIRQELEERLEELKSQGKLLEAQRLSARTKFDLEMLMEAGFLSGHRELFEATLWTTTRKHSRHVIQLFPG